MTNSTMATATRLAREGRLTEALSLLQSLHKISSVTSPIGTTNPNPSPTPSASTKHPMGRFALSPLKTLTPLPARAPSPPLPSGARFEEHSYAGSEGSLNYKVYVPSSYRGESWPLVVMLHGCKQSPDDFAAGTRMNDVAEEKKFLVAYPAQSGTANPSNCWNWFRSDDQVRDKGEPALIAGITRQVIRDFAVDTSRVYIAGLSAGGAAAAIMGSTYPDIYAAVGVHSGLACGAASDLPSAFAAMKQGGSFANEQSKNVVPTIVLHGDRDKTVNPANGDQVIARAPAAARIRRVAQQGQSAGGAHYTRIMLSDEQGTPTMEQWVLHGVAHAWSGGSVAGSYTHPNGVDASQEMVRFFLEHRR